MPVLNVGYNDLDAIRVAVATMRGSGDDATFRKWDALLHRIGGIDGGAAIYGDEFGSPPDDAALADGSKAEVSEVVRALGICGHVRPGRIVCKRDAEHDGDHDFGPEPASWAIPPAALDRDLARVLQSVDRLARTVALSTLATLYPSFKARAQAELQRVAELDKEGG